MRKFLRKMLGDVQVFFSILMLIIAAFVVFVTVFAPIWPILTFLFFAAGTIFTLYSKPTALMSLGGIALYTVSWAVAVWSVIPGQMVCFAGIVLWFYAFFRTFKVIRSYA